MTHGTMFEQWQIVLLPFPFTDLSGAKKRPALIVSKSGFNRSHDDLVCCLITSNVMPEENCVMINESDLKHGRLPFESKIKPYRIFTAEKSIVIKKLGELNDKKSEETKKNLLKLFN